MLQVYRENVEASLGKELLFFLSFLYSFTLSDALKYFAQCCLTQTLASCREQVCKELDIPVEECELSMGMSGDFELAVSILNCSPPDDCKIQ